MSLYIFMTHLCPNSLLVLSKPVVTELQSLPYHGPGTSSTKLSSWLRRSKIPNPSVDRQVYMVPSTVSSVSRFFLSSISWAQAQNLGTTWVPYTFELFTLKQQKGCVEVKASGQGSPRKTSPYHLSPQFSHYKCYPVRLQRCSQRKIKNIS